MWPPKLDSRRFWHLPQADSLVDIYIYIFFLQLFAQPLFYPAHVSMFQNLKVCRLRRFRSFRSFILRSLLAHSESFQEIWKTRPWWRELPAHSWFLHGAKKGGYIMLYPFHWTQWLPHFGQILAMKLMKGPHFGYRPCQAPLVYHGILYPDIPQLEIWSNKKSNWMVSWFERCAPFGKPTWLFLQRPCAVAPNMANILMANLGR